jgi:hypothetical protein
VLVRGRILEGCQVAVEHAFVDVWPRPGESRARAAHLSLVGVSGDEGQAKARIRRSGSAGLSPGEAER